MTYADLGKSVPLTEKIVAKYLGDLSTPMAKRMVDGVRNDSRKREGFLIAVCAKYDGDPVPIDLYVCPQCGKMQQFASEKTRRRLKRGTLRGP